MALELLSLLCTFENSTKRGKISFDSHSFFRIAKRSVVQIPDSKKSTPILMTMSLLFPCALCRDDDASVNSGLGPISPCIEA